MKKIRSLSLTAWIFIALLSGIVVGLCFINNSEFTVSYIRPWGALYLNLLRFIVVPVVLFSIMGAIVSMQDIRKVGSIGGRTVLFYIITTLSAIIIGLVTVNIFKGSFEAFETTNLVYEEAETPGVIDIIVNMFPSNVIAPLLNETMLQIIVIALLVGFGVILSGEKGKTVTGLIESLNEVFMKVMSIIIKVSPIGVFCLIAPVIAESGPGILGNLFTLLLVVYLCYLLHIFLVYMPIIVFIGKMNPLKFLKTMVPAMMFAFSCSSSVGTLPLNMECCAKLGARKNVLSFTLPLGATINMDGLALYLGVASVFIASCYGIELTLAQMLTIVVAATLGSIGAAGVPGVAMVMLAIVLRSVNLPVEGIALVAGIDRILDMGRTVVNVTGDAACSTIISRLETRKENKHLAKNNGKAV